MMSMAQKHSKLTLDINTFITLRIHTLSCWLSNSDGTFWAFLGPIMLIIAVYKLLFLRFPIIIYFCFARSTVSSWL